MITYNDIYEAAKKERHSTQLQILPKKFVHEVADYLKEKKVIALKEEDVFSDSVLKTKKQLENAVTLFRELMLRRRKKILGLVLIAAETGISKQDYENMFDFEKELFEDIMKCVEGSDKKLNESLIGKKQEENRNHMILFTEQVEEFLDLNGNKMGPFEKGQMANISKDIAKILIGDGKAEMIEE